MPDSPHGHILDSDPMDVRLRAAWGGSTIWGAARAADDWECRMELLLPPDIANADGAEFCLQCEQFHTWPDWVGA